MNRIAAMELVFREAALGAGEDPRGKYPQAAGKLKIQQRVQLIKKICNPSTEIPCVCMFECVCSMLGSH